MKKLDAIRILNQHGNEARFVGNVISCHHRRPAARLVKLAQLVLAGSEICFASYSMDHLLLDGYNLPWDELDARTVEELRGWADSRCNDQE